MHLHRPKLILFTSLSLMGIFASMLVPLGKVSALSGSSFNATNIISDSVFYNANSMSPTDIQLFLNAKVPTCDTNGNQMYNSTQTRAQYSATKGYSTPFTCLKDYTQAIPGVAADAYCNRGVPGGTQSAAQIIYDVSQACNISPKVLIVLLQKEQGLVTDDWPWSIEYRSATGYGCPDSTPDCDSDYYGFFNQVYNAAHQFRRYVIQPQNFNFAAGRTSFVSYQANNPGCGGTSLTIQNGATAALYNYTPYQPNAAALANLYGTGDGCSAYGNRNFWRYFNDWFGSTQTNVPYDWSVNSIGIYADPGMTQSFTNDTTVAPGGKVYIQVKVTNIGNQTWTQSAVNFGTYRPAQRTSPFYDAATWLNPYRPATLTEASVPPGGVGTFSFDLKAPATTGQYQEYFGMVAENISWFNDLGTSIIINVVSPVAPSLTNTGILASGAVLHPSEVLLSPDGESALTLQNDGNLVQYSNFRAVWNTVTFGRAPDRLEMGTDGNLVLHFKDGSSWSTNTSGHPGAYLKLQTDGNLVLYDANGNALWNTATFQTTDHLSYVNTNLQAGTSILPGQQIQTADRRYRLIFQTDGNLVLYSSAGHALWNSVTQGTGAALVTLQADGNLVIYGANGRALWNSVTFGNASSRLVIQQDGNLALYNAVGRATWNTVTFGQF